MMFLNNAVVAVKIAGAPEVRQVKNGEHTITKVPVHIVQNKKSGDNWEHQHGEIWAEAWNKTGEKLQGLPVGHRLVLMCRLAFSLYTIEGNQRTKWYLDVSNVEHIDKVGGGKPAAPAPAPKPTQKREPEPEPDPDDIPF